MTFVDHTKIPPLAYLGPQARIVMLSHEARIVFPGMEYRVEMLRAAAQSLQQLHQLVQQYGPLPAAA